MKPVKGQKTTSLIEYTVGNSLGNNPLHFFLSPFLAASVEPQS